MGASTFGRAAGPVVAALGCVLALATDPVSAKPKSVPFKATVTTSEAIVAAPARCAGAYFGGSITGRGNASHLGSIRFASTDCIVPGPNGFAFENGLLSITAANGDTLTGTYSGTLLPLPPYTVNGYFTITGGTGRFADATGSGYLQGTQNISVSPGVGEIELIGTLSY